MLRGVSEKAHDPEPDLDNANVGMLTEPHSRIVYFG